MAKGRGWDIMSRSYDDDARKNYDRIFGHVDSTEESVEHAGCNSDNEERYDENR